MGGGIFIGEGWVNLFSLSENPLAQLGNYMYSSLLSVLSL